MLLTSLCGVDDTLVLSLIELVSCRTAHALISSHIPMGVGCAGRSASLGSHIPGVGWSNAGDTVSIRISVRRS